MKVLLVEDDEDSRSLLGELLGERFDVTTAENGKEGLELVAESPPDVVISDESLPGMRGTALAREVKLRWPWVRFVLVSGFATVPGAESCDLVLKKPVDVEGLLRAVENLARGSHASQREESP